MKKILQMTGFIVILFCVVIQLARPAPAWAQAASSGGLGVNNAILNLAAQPDQVYTHQMLVSSGAGAPPMDITVDAMGFGEGLNGEFIPLPAESDQSPYSARTWIKSFNKTSFHLDPGSQVEIDATVNLPHDLGSDTRYAIIYIHSAPVSAGGQNGVGNILAVSVPVIITPPNAVINKTGEVGEVKIDPVEAGKPIQIVTSLKNTGNRHYRVKGTAAISDASGKVVTMLDFPPTSTSVFPTFTRQVTFTYSSLDHPEGLQPGKYGVDIKILQEDGTLIGEKQSIFEVSKPYAPFAGVDPSLVTIVSFDNQEPGLVDASAKADVKIQFEGTGPVTGSVAIVKYPQAPALQPAFADEPGNGGLGATAVKYIGIRTAGFSKGVAHLQVLYRSNELASIQSASDLLLANYQANVWARLANLEVQSGAQLVKGDLSAATLDAGETVALGGASSPEINGQASQAQPGGGLDTGTLVFYGVAGIGGLGLIGLFAFLILSRGRSAKAKR
ncbi:MAG TPA: hypothetical protein VMT46_11550 [Anaerolineaceae bacterium]|nr:hypothetical protein [Anaerolineaceae bacterium]